MARTADEIIQWLTAYLADALDLEAESIDADADLREHGLDSSAAITLTGDLEDWLHKDVDPALLEDHRSIRAVARFLAS